MPGWPLLVLWWAWVLTSVYSVWQCKKFLSHLRLTRRSWPDYHPNITVIVPFRGLEPELPACLRSLCTQACENYRLVLVLESPEDAAAQVIVDELQKYPLCQAELQFAGPSGPHEGQKVHNQLFVLRQLETEARDDDVWVFADSDAVPGLNWLHQLVRPLAKRARGASTGYRWLMPAEGNGGTLWTKLACVINSSVACFYWRTTMAQAWGGSMALRVDTAREGQLINRLSGSLSDDYTVSAMCRDLGRRIYFVPACLVATTAAYDLGLLLEFGRRQYRITRIYSPRLYWLAILISTLWMVGLATAWTALVLRLSEGTRWTWPAAAIALVCLMNHMRSAVRISIIEQAFGADIKRRLLPTLRVDRWATPLWMTLHWLIIVSAIWGRTIRWRGISYRMQAPQCVRRIS